MSMKFVASCMALTFVLVSLSAWTGGHAGPVSGDSDLKMTAAIGSASYCLFHNNSAPSVARTGFAHFNLTIHIQNTSGHNVILCKMCAEQIDPEFWLVNPDGTPGERVLSYCCLHVDYPQVPTHRKPGDAYAILRPQEVYERDIPLWVDVDLGTTEVPKGKGVMPQGRYVFRAAALTWGQDSKSTAELKRRWAQFGELSSEKIESGLMPIDLRFPDVVTPCSN